MIRLDKLFEVKYGINLELNSLTICDRKDENSINFVSRISGNNGISAFVEKIAGLEPQPAGTISVSGGGSVLEAFLQTEPYYSGRDLFYLIPRYEMTDEVKLYYCACIRANKYKYNYGRQANKTLRSILVPSLDEIPDFVKMSRVPDLKLEGKVLNITEIELKPYTWKAFKYSQLFKIERGIGPRIQDIEEGTTPFITSINSNNGLTSYVNYVATHKGNTITVNRNGSVGEAFYQKMDFCSTEDVHVFNPLFPMNKYVAIFFITLIKKEKYRYSYGRKWGIDRMKNSIIYLPINDDGTPDFTFMENYIKSLKYSDSI